MSEVLRENPQENLVESQQEKAPADITKSQEEIEDQKAEKVAEFFGYTRQEIEDEKTEPGIHANKKVWIDQNIRTLEGVIQSTLMGANIEENPDVIRRLAADDDVRFEYVSRRTASTDESQAPFDARQFYVDKIADIKAK